MTDPSYGAKHPPIEYGAKHPPIENKKAPFGTFGCFFFDMSFSLFWIFLFSPMKLKSSKISIIPGIKLPLPNGLML